MKKLIIAALALGATLALAGGAQAERSNSPIDKGFNKQRTAVAGLVQTGNANAQAFVTNGGSYTRNLWKSEVYSGSLRSK